MLNDYNTPTNSRILSELVRREVIHSAGQLVSHLAAQGDQFDDAETLYGILSKPQYTHEYEYECECGYAWAVSNDEPEDLIELDDLEDGDQGCNCHECGTMCSPSEVSGYDADPLEALEFWIVSRWFAAQLEERGELVGEVLDFHVWGRTCSGQAIAADDIISQIAESMEILDGQAYSWADRV